MQLSRVSRLSAPAGLIVLLTMIMLGAMAFAVPPSRLEVKVSGVERGYLASHSRFSSVLASQLARTGYSYLAIDLTSATRDPLWMAHLDKVNEVQFPVWGWLEIDSEYSKARLDFAARATGKHKEVARANAVGVVFLQVLQKDPETLVGDKLLQDDRIRADTEAFLAALDGDIETIRNAIATFQAALEPKAPDLWKTWIKMAAPDRLREAVEELEAAAYAKSMQDAHKRSTAAWKLDSLVPSLNLRGLLLYGSDAVERAASLRARNPSLAVLPVLCLADPRPGDGTPFAVALTADEFAEHAGEIEYPVLLAQDLELDDIEKLREKSKGNYLIAPVAIAKR